VASQAFLALGSNLGQRQVNLQSAVNALGELMAVGSLSPVYETEPWGITNQPRFLNACMTVETTLSPEELLAALKSTEKKLGRKPGTHWGPRLIDIDLLFYDDLVIDASELSVPHPQ
jgi:2-amino-4-hydroxy-6-hydroxymethyldihydropteridine diphosphokinase